jgi:hypothetical protein
VIDQDGREHKLTFEDLKGYTEFNFADGTLCIAMLRMEAKFGPRFAALQLRLHKLYILEVDPAIIDLTNDEPAASSSSIKTPESTPKKRQRDPDVVEVDSL